MTGIDQAAISKLENGKIPHPRFETVITLAEALRMDPRALKFGQPESSEATA
jgi:transcriptional regulator with XRE-family HTH domain